MRSRLRGMNWVFALASLPAYAGYDSEAKMHMQLVVAFQVALAISVFSVLACVVALRRRRWFLAAAFAGLFASAPLSAIFVGSGGSLMCGVLSAELGFFLYLGPLAHEPGERWSHSSRAILLTLCAACLLADWSREQFSWAWINRLEPAVLAIPLLTLLLWLSSWVLTRPLLRAFAEWPILSLVERRVLLVSLLGTAPLVLSIAVYSARLLFWSLVFWPTSVHMFDSVL